MHSAAWCLTSTRSSPSATERIRRLLIELRSRRDQPFYYLFAENEQTPYIAYVSEQNLLADTSDEPVQHPQVDDMFERDETGCYRRRKAR